MHDLECQVEEGLRGRRVHVGPNRRRGRPPGPLPSAPSGRHHGTPGRGPLMAPLGGPCGRPAYVSRALRRAPHGPHPRAAPLLHVQEKGGLGLLPDGLPRGARPSWGPGAQPPVSQRWAAGMARGQAGRLARAARVTAVTVGPLPLPRDSTEWKVHVRRARPAEGVAPRVAPCKAARRATVCRPSRAQLRPERPWVLFAQPSGRAGLTLPWSCASHFYRVSATR